MTKRFAFLLLTAALGMAAAQTSTPAAPASAADTQLSKETVTFDIRRAGNDLASLLVALAKSAGYEVIIEPTADTVLKSNSTQVGTAASGANANTSTTVAYSFYDKPFNEVWPLILDIYGLSYEYYNIGSKPILRVSVNPIQKIIKLPNSLKASAVERQLKLAFGSLKTISETTSNTSQQPVNTNTQTASTTTGTTSSREEIVLDSPTMRIVSESSSNSVIIRGTNQEVSQVERLLNQIIAVQPAQAQNSAPIDPVDQTVQRVYAVKGAQADIVALLAAQYPGLKVTPVGQTGQLVITGPQNQLDAAVTLLGQVDRVAPVVAGAQITQRVFQLVNASAEEVKATLEGTLARELTTSSIVPNATLIDPTTGQPYTTGALANAPLNPVSSTTGTGTTATDTKAATASIIADKRTNTLIVRGTADQVAQVADLIPNLDQRVPQINVQVRIQEITETASRSLGMDWKAGFGGFTVSAGSGGLGAAFDPTRSLVGFNLGATLNTLQGQGLSKSVYDGAITMQSGQRSLGSGTSTQNASGSAAATIKSGGRLELNVPSTAANVAPIQKQIDYGVNLDFFDPQVAPDGTITMRVRGQINDLRTAITADTVPNLLQFVNSEAQTTLTFKNGETLLLSGLLKTTESTNRDGVPFLSSIPVIGGLFGREATKKEQTQLLVVITGNVVK